MPESFLIVSMAGDDKIIPMLGHILQWLLGVSDPERGTEESSGSEAHKIIFHCKLLVASCSVLSVLQSIFSYIMSFDTTTCGV